MIVGDGKEKIPEGTQPLQGRVFIEPGVVLEFDLLEGGIGFGMESLYAQLVVHAVMDLVEPFDKGCLTYEAFCIGVLFVEIRQRRATELAGEHIGNCFKKLPIGWLSSRRIVKGGVMK